VPGPTIVLSRPGLRADPLGVACAEDVTSGCIGGAGTTPCHKFRELGRPWDSQPDHGGRFSRRSRFSPAAMGKRWGGRGMLGFRVFNTQLGMPAAWAALFDLETRVFGLGPCSSTGITFPAPSGRPRVFWWGVSAVRLGDLSGKNAIRQGGAAPGEKISGRGLGWRPDPAGRRTELLGDRTMEPTRIAALLRPDDVLVAARRRFYAPCRKPRLFWRGPIRSFQRAIWLKAANAFPPGWRKSSCQLRDAVYAD